MFYSMILRQTIEGQRALVMYSTYLWMSNRTLTPFAFESLYLLMLAMPDPQEQWRCWTQYWRRSAWLWRSTMSSSLPTSGFVSISGSVSYFSSFFCYNHFYWTRLMAISPAFSLFLSICATFCYFICFKFELISNSHH